MAELKRLPPLLVAAAIAFGLLLLLCSSSTSAKAAAEQCGGDVEQLEAKCKEFIGIAGPKKEPSETCCDEVHKYDIVCLCKRITPELEKRISVEKAIYISRFCGKTVPAGTKCGSYTVPPAA